MARRSELSIYVTPQLSYVHAMTRPQNTEVSSLTFHLGTNAAPFFRDPRQAAPGSEKAANGMHGEPVLSTKRSTRAWIVAFGSCDLLSMGRAVDQAEYKTRSD